MKRITETTIWHFSEWYENSQVTAIIKGIDFNGNKYIAKSYIGMEGEIVEPMDVKLEKDINIINRLRESEILEVKERANVVLFSSLSDKCDCDPIDEMTLNISTSYLYKEDIDWLILELELLKFNLKKSSR